MFLILTKQIKYKIRLQCLNVGLLDRASEVGLVIVVTPTLLVWISIVY